ncbi:hypothetical protein FB480_101824 [Agrobacterium vitis]|nr:hypothetical protein FB480_101824 [Agrobacterium vitis]
MQWYHLAIGACAIFAYIVSNNVPNGRRWCLLITGSYVISCIYAHAVQYASFWMPQPVAIAFVCDAIVFKIIDESHDKKQDKNGPRLLMLASASINFIQLTALIFKVPEPLAAWAHSSLLEAITAIALLWIGGYGITKRLADGQYNGFYHMGHCRINLAAFAVQVCKAGEQKTDVRQPLKRR